MNTKMPSVIQIKGAKTNNLKNVSLTLPHHQFTVVTGISGSGKSSLVFEIIAKEGQRRYFETLPSFARQFLGKLNRPEVDEIKGLSPVISIGQSTAGMHSRSTVGTLTDLHDFIRLLYARTGHAPQDVKLTKSLFSFSSDIGKCQRCNGIGKEEEIDLTKLIRYPEKSIREGALAPTLPNGYIMYSQVTIEVLNQVCEAEGFHVDIPWKDLTAEQQHVILYGSTKIKVPFGKHSLESRLKWTGIKAKPREEGHYKGMIPIMSDILRRDRNANILKYVHSVTCPDCNGSRLNPTALSVTIHSLTIAQMEEMEINQLYQWLTNKNWNTIGLEIVNKIQPQLALLIDLGLGHLTLNRPSNTLRANEIQRLRISNQILAPLSDVLYVFDEPSVGLHPEENTRLIYHLKELVNQGNTVIVVEHDLHTISQADHIVEIGPQAGYNGGEILFNGSLTDFVKQPDATKSPTLHALRSTSIGMDSKTKTHPENSISLIGCYARNLKRIDVHFQLGKLNVVSGKSGAGKSALVKEILHPLVRQHLGLAEGNKLALKAHKNLEKINKLIFIDHTPIGKTPRSNPATYLGISDHIRDLFASLPQAKEKKYTKSRFSFNNKGGRCEKCQGAGKTQIGMHFLGNVDLICESCNGQRFNKETLTITYNNFNIAQVYQLSVQEALTVFEGHKKILNGLQALVNVGLGYLRIGQSSTTLSGGEAQRIKIANQLQKKDTGNTLYIIIEPSTGLHSTNIESLLSLFNQLQQQGNTIVCLEQNTTIIQHADWHIELGPESGTKGGQIIHQGSPKKAEQLNIKVPTQKPGMATHISLHGISTNGLKNVSVQIPKKQLTVVTGVSGSGKSSLVYDTLFAESNARFTESLSTYNRSFLQQNSQAEIQSYSGLGPAIGIHRKGGTPSKRSTVGTLSGIYDAYRILFSRVAQQEGKNFTAQHFSFNHHLGACTTCQGAGSVITCNPDEIIAHPAKTIWDGAFAEHKSLVYYTNVHGQFMATLQAAATQNNWNLDKPWTELKPEVQHAILYGTGNTQWEVTWNYKTKTKEGVQHLTASWKGLCHYINEEHQRILHTKKADALNELMHYELCPSCQGNRLKPELLGITFNGVHISELSALTIEESFAFLQQPINHLADPIQHISQSVLPTVLKALHTLSELGLNYVSVNRAVHTLSGGERQRVNLAGQLAGNLYGVTYVLDEPTIGLDAAQVKVLIHILKTLTANGNTVVVVEHDKDFIQQADYLIEMGPGAGSLGGEVMYQGSVEGAQQHPKLLTYKMWNAAPVTPTPKELKPTHCFGVKGASANNLKGIDVNFYAQRLIAVTGVSGSGKSSLIHQVLLASWKKQMPVNCDHTFGLTHFEELFWMSQQAAAHNRLSTPISITGILGDLQLLFSKTEKAKVLGFKKADFSYLSKNGKCSTCGGNGKVKTSMDFMSDIWLTCDACQGNRYQPQIAQVSFNGKTLGDILQFTVLEALTFFEDPKITGKLAILKEVGLAHLILGQAGNTLSEGEVQRLKLANTIIKQPKGNALYLFDEPSTGLHHFDMIPLLNVFQKLTQQGHTVIYIEHNPTFINAADQAITLGPGSGVNGGQLV